MSVQTVGQIAREPVEKKIEPQLVLVKDGPLKGKEIKIISLDNQSAIDSEKESTRSALKFLASCVACLFWITLCVLGMVFGAGALPIIAGGGLVAFGFFLFG